MLETVAVVVASLGLAGVIPNPWALGLSAAALAGAVVFAATGLVQVRSISTVVAAAPLLGKEAVARTALDPDGMVAVQGERWRAAIIEGTAVAGERVRIVGVQGHSLRVEKKQSS